MDVPAEIVNAFVDGGDGGNPAGVVLRAEGLDSSQKLAIAGRLGPGPSLLPVTMTLESERGGGKRTFHFNAVKVQLFDTRKKLRDCVTRKLAMQRG